MSLFETPVPPRTRQTALFACVGALTIAAWLSLSLSPSWPAHHHISSHGASSPSLFALFVTGWAVMTVAMMLPTTLPILMTFHTLAGERRDRPVLLSLVMTGYIVTWVAFGVLVYFGYVGLNRLVGANLPAEWRAYADTLLLILAGAFQFSSLKYRCLDKCRSPFSFVAEHWQGRRERWQAFRLGFDHGVFCVGCCWALMLLMFLVGTGSLWWMFALAVVMAIEKNMPWGPRFSRPLGVALIASGVSLLALV